jgi:hypothetical protein
VPLEVPLPDVDSILVDGDRRLAIVGGRIVAVGSSVGQRTIDRIEPDGVVFREASGLEIRATLGPSVRPATIIKR